MVRVPYLRARLVAATFLAISAAPAGAQASGAEGWGFENGSLSAWTATGDAFANQPTFGNNVAARRPGESPGQDGYYWVGTYENFPNSRATYGAVQGDGPQGRLVSDPFVIDGQSISFLIGGGRDSENEYVGLLVRHRPGTPPPPPNRPDLTFPMPDGVYQLFDRATGRDDEHMIRTIWDVTRFRGETARLVIVDKASGPWGHINADSFQLSWQPYLTAANTGPGRALPPGASPPATAYPVGGGSVVVSPPSGGGPGTAVPVEPNAPVTAYPVGGGSIVVSPPSGGAPAASPVGGPSGHFQLIALQIVANHQTRDDALESDGPGDELQVRSDNLTFAADGRFVRTDTRTSGIFGAPDRWDFIAGTATPGFSAHSDAGGFKSGDIYPRSLRPVRTNGDLPMILWDGTLERGGNGVVIIPSLWEIEDRGVSRAQTAWDNALVRDRSLGLSVVQAFNRVVEDRDSPVLDYLPGATAVFDDGNRPVGAAVHQLHFPLPGAPLPHDAGMRPQSIVLTYDKAMLFAARRATALELRPEPGTVVFDGLPVPRGGIVLQFVDPPGNDGDYYLITQLVQVP